jgi:Domain of unknown function (DUF4399)
MMLGARRASWLRWTSLSALVSSRTVLERNQGNIMPLLRMALLGAALALLPAAALAQAKTTPKDAVIYIASPEDGATVKGAFWCRFGLRNMGVAPAGHDFPNTGHHHLLIDTKEPINPNEPIPHDKMHLHFGGGESEVLLDLPQGKHTLQLVLGDSNHFSFNPPLISKRITITVRGDDDSDDDNDRVSKRSRHRSSHRTHRTHFANVRKDRQAEPTPNGQVGCPYHGLWGLLKGCQEAASTPAKPPAAR